VTKVQCVDGFCPKRAGLPEPNGKTFYLASPYSHPDPFIKHQRYVQVVAIAAVLFEHGYTLIEPIGSSHPAAMMFTLPTGYQFWQERDRNFILASDGVIVCQMKGWEESVGVTDEIVFAKRNSRAVYLLDPREVLANYQEIG
jgi:Domain of unknown function (DUF1937)